MRLVVLAAHYAVMVLWTTIFCIPGNIVGGYRILLWGYG